MYIVITRDGVIHQTDDVELYAALLDHYGEEITGQDGDLRLALSGVRQREITRQQVLNKRDQARRAALDAASAAPKARTGEEYEEIVRRGVKAAQDYETWSKVLPSL